MNFLKDAHTRIGQSFRFSRLLGVVAVLMLGAMAAMAQSAPPDMDFHDYKSDNNTRYVSTGRAFTGSAGGYVHGSIRNGKLIRLSIGLAGDSGGPNGLKRHLVYYDADSPNHSSYAPLALWYNVNATTKRLVIRYVRATQEFNGTSTYSLGVSKVEIQFINGAPGKIVVSYTHRSYERLYGEPKVPKRVKAYNGTIFSGSPVNGRRLFYELL